MNSVSIWSCPGAERLKQEFAEAVDDSLGVVLVPEKFALWPFLESVRAYLDRHIGSVHLFAVDNTCSLKQGLVAAMFEEAAGDGGLGPADPEAACLRPDISMEDLTGMSAYRGSRLIAFVAEALTPASRALLLAQLRELGDAVKRAKDSRRSLEWHLLVVVPAMPGMEIPRELFLREYACWGWFRPSDLEYVIEQSLVRFKETPADYQWFSALCHGLARMDLELVPAIATAMPKSREDITSLLLAHELASLDEGTRSDINRLVSQETGVAGLWMERPRDPLRDRCWCAGVYNLDCYGYPSVHPAALASCSLVQTLEQVLVRGQIQVYFPQVLEVHHCILRIVTATRRKLGSLVDREYGDECTYDIGPLYNYLKWNSRYYSNRVISVAESWRKVRNKLAHNRFLPYDEAMEAYAAFEELKQEYEVV